MKRRKRASMLSVFLIPVLLIVVAAPAFAGEQHLTALGSGLVKRAAITRDVKYDVHSDSDEELEEGWEDGVLLEDYARSAGTAGIASPSVADVEFKITQTELTLDARTDALVKTEVSEEFNGSVLNGAADGWKKEGAITFYMPRKIEDNTSEFPPVATVVITQADNGREDIGELKIGPSQAWIDEGKSGSKVAKASADELIEVKSDDTYLESGGSAAFSVSFINEAVKNGTATFNMINSPDHYIQISGPEGSGLSWKIRILYGADGLWMYYSAESVAQYEGTVINDGSQTYVNVGKIDLNEKTAPSFTIKHKFGVYKGGDSSTRIISARLNPDGPFTFPGDVQEKELETVQVDDDMYVYIPIRVKQTAFNEWRRQAVSKKKSFIRYELLTDLVIVYSDGYEAGGNMNSLPLVYQLKYTSTSGGSSGGGGGGGGGGGSTPGAIVNTPAATPRTTYSAAGDVGWVQKDGVWYYMSAANIPVTDWLLGPDGRWYFLGMGGVMKVGWSQIGGVWYFFNADGAMATGWVQGSDGIWYYLLPGGAMATDMETPDGYRVDSSGAWVK